jgi:putative hydroxymethylpyrimidine transport system substrate-binding protein
VALEGHPGRAFLLEELGVPPYDELIMVANSSKLADPRLPRFLDAVERGTLYLINNPEECWGLLIRNHKELDQPLNRKAFTDTLARFDHSPSALDRRRYIRFAEFMKDRKLIEAVPPLDHYATELP